MMVTLDDINVDQAAQNEPSVTRISASNNLILQLYTLKSP